MLRRLLPAAGSVVLAGALAAQTGLAASGNPGDPKPPKAAEIQPSRVPGEGALADGRGQQAEPAPFSTDTLPEPAAPPPFDPAAAMAILRDRCLGCHSDKKKKGGLSMVSREALLRGSSNGPVAEPGDAAKSFLIQALAPEADPHMPPDEQLGPGEIAALETWVAAGAPWDAAALRQRPDEVEEVVLAPLPAGFQPALAVAVSPDGKRLAAGRGDTITLYDLEAESHKVAATLTGHQGAVRALAWSPDGTQLAAGAFRQVTVWDPAGGARLYRLEGLVGRVTALGAFPAAKEAPAGWIVADSQASRSGVVRIYPALSRDAPGAPPPSEDPAEPKGPAVDEKDERQPAPATPPPAPEVSPGTAWTAHWDSIHDLAVSADGKLLATAGADGLAKLWSLGTTGKVEAPVPTAVFEGHDGPVLSLAFKPDGTRLATGGEDTDIHVWEIPGGGRTATVTRHPGAVLDLAWGGDGKTFVSACDDGAPRFNEESRKTPARTGGGTGDVLHALALATGGERIYGGIDDGRVAVWDAGGKKVAELEAPPADPALAAAGATDPDPAPPPGDGQPLSFVSDILPTLAKAGCSAGRCHAKPKGQNGFKLSVFAHDPAADHREIVKDARGRRVFPAAPEHSLLLRKPTLAIDHEGGRRFEPGSPPYQLLREWIRQGMPYRRPGEPDLAGLAVSPEEGSYPRGGKVQLAATAHYDDGTTRDVTALAEFTTGDNPVASVEEGGLVTVGDRTGEAAVVVRFLGQVAVARITVPPGRLLPAEVYAALPQNNFIDRLAYERHRALGLRPSEPCTDGEFLRRSSLDLAGVLPNPGEVRAFLADTSSDKRRRLVERLLRHPGYADRWAGLWADLLRPNPDRAGVKSVYLFDRWIRSAFRDNLPMDAFAREVVAARGSTHRHGPAVFFRDRRTPADLAAATAQVFLGLRLECARCHHHPNERWSQADFYRLAAFFGEVKRKGDGVSPPISGGYEYIYHAPGGTVQHPVSGDVLPPTPPGAGPAEVPAGTDPREVLAGWMARPDNPYFARAVVNRAWAELMGRGFVEPVDDFRASNPPTNAPLLDALAEDFVRSGFDHKHLLQTIATSHLYGLSSRPNETNAGDTTYHSRAARKPLRAEVLADAIADLTGSPDSFEGLPSGARAARTWNFKTRSNLLDAFGRPDSSSDPPCERERKSSLVQALHLMHAERLQGKLADKGGRAASLAAGGSTPEAIVEEIYLAAYCRFPTPDEQAVAVGVFAAEGATRQTAAEDLLWALINTPEFVFNH